MKITHKKIFWWGLLLTLLFFISIPGLRFLAEQPVLAGEESYYHLRMAAFITENGIPEKDPLVERDYLLQPYHLLLSFTTSIELFSVLIPLIAGLLSFILFYFILRNLNLGIHEVSLTLVAFILSPLSLFLFSTSNEHSLSVVLLLAGFLLFITGRFLFSLLFFIATPFFGIIAPLMGILALLVYSLNNKEKMKPFLFITVSVLLITFSYYGKIFFNYGLPYFGGMQPILTNLVSDFGGNTGFGIYSLILGLVGLSVVWGRKKQITGYLLFILMIVLSFAYPEINLYLNFIVAIFAGYGFLSVIKLKWELDMLKTLTILLVIFGLLFSTLSYITRVTTSSPDSDIVESLVWLQENSREGEVVFSHSSKGHWIQAISEREVILDPKTTYLKGFAEKSNDSNTLFYSRNLIDTNALFDKYDIQYIWIDAEMKDGQVWVREKEGLLFLFRNEETFKKIFENEQAEIWVVLT